MFQGRRNSGRAAAGAVKELMAMETLRGNTQKHRCPHASFCSAIRLTPKLLIEILENHSEISGCANM